MPVPVLPRHNELYLVRSKILHLTRAHAHAFAVTENVRRQIWLSIAQLLPELSQQGATKGNKKRGIEKVTFALLYKPEVGVQSKKERR